MSDERDSGRTAATKLRVCAASVVCVLLTLSIGARAGERELDESAPPSATSGIETPLQRLFAEERERVALFPRLSRFLRARFPRFLADSQFDARSRLYYLRTDRTTDDLSEALAAGGSLYFHSGWLGDALAVEVEGFTSQRLTGANDRDGTLLLAPGQDGLSVLGIANAKLRHRGIVLTGFRQYLDLPYANREDNRMIPNTFESVTLQKTEGTLRFSTGYTWKVKLRDSDRFESMTKALGLSKDRALIHAGALFEPNEGFRVGAISALVPDLYTSVYGEVGVEADWVPGWETRFDAQFTYQEDIGEDLLGTDLDDGWNLGLRAAASRAGIVLRLGFAITGPGAKIVDLYGTNPSYVGLITRTFTSKDEKALLVSASYDFAQVGFDGLTAICNFVTAFDGDRRPGVRDEAQEVDLTVDYRVKKGWLKGFWLRVRGAWLHERGASRDGAEMRVILRYDLPVI